MWNEICAFRNVSDTRSVCEIGVGILSSSKTTPIAFQFRTLRDLGCPGVEDFANSFEEDEDFVHGIQWFLIFGKRF